MSHTPQAESLAELFSAEIPIVIEFSQAEILPKYGIGYPRTEDQLRWLYRRRAENGLGDCFSSIAGRVLFKPRRYIQISSGQR